MTQVKLLFIADYVIDIEKDTMSDLELLRSELEAAIDDVDFEISRRRGGE